MKCKNKKEIILNFFVIRKRNFRSESEAPATPQVPRITRRTRATSVAAETSKKSAEAPAKRRQRLISIPIEPSLIEEKNDFGN